MRIARARITLGVVFPAAIWAILAGAGCTPTWYAKDADKTAYKTIGAAQQVAIGERPGFDVTYRPIEGEGSPLPGVVRVAGVWIPTSSKPPAWALLGGAMPFDAAGGLGTGGAGAFLHQAALFCGLERAAAPATLSLSQCLEIAQRNSRSYQTQKEQLYSAALNVANLRRGWDWSLFGGSLTGEAGTTRTDAETSTHFGNAGANLNFTQQFINGGVLALGTSLDLASDLLGTRGTTVGSLLDANFTQPLLRGAWHGFAYEPQYRLERDFLFSVFEYERFTQTFSADIAIAYYNVLEQRDQLEINLGDVARREETYRITRVLWRGGQKSKIEADEAEQQWLNAQVNYEQAKQTYQDRLDTLKITMGLPIRVHIRLDYPDELAALEQVDLPGMPFSEDEAIDVALSTRPDVLRKRAAARDASRNVEIAANNFLPQLDVELGINAAGTPPRDFWATRFNHPTRFASTTFDYNLDQTVNRNAYRDSLLAEDKSRRDLAEFLDTVRLAVRDSYRELAQTKRTYEIRVRDVEVAIQRSSLAARQQAQGLASTRDVTTAQDDLRRAQSSRTSALVSYINTRLRLLAVLGMLTVDEKGMFHERKGPFRFDRLAERYQYVAPAATP